MKKPQRKRIQIQKLYEKVGSKKHDNTPENKVLVGEYRDDEGNTVLRTIRSYSM